MVYKSGVHCALGVALVALVASCGGGAGTDAMDTREAAVPKDTAPADPGGFDSLAAGEQQDVVVLNLAASNTAPVRQDSVFFADTGTTKSFGRDLQVVAEAPGDGLYVRSLTGGIAGELFAVIETPAAALAALAGTATYTGTAVLRVSDIPSETVYDDSAATAELEVNYGGTTSATFQMTRGTRTNALGVSRTFSNGQIGMTIDRNGNATMELTGFDGAVLTNPDVRAVQVFAGPAAEEIAGIARGKTDDTEATVVYAGAK